MKMLMSRAALALLVIVRLVHAAPEIATPSSKVVIYPVYKGDGDSQADSHVAAESQSSSKAISEISLNLASSLQLKKVEETPKGPTVVNPMVSPRNRYPGSRNRLRPQSNKDSYLDALEHSHAIKDVRENLNLSKLARREYTPGPVYRGEDNAVSSSNRLETDAKISRISYSGSSSITPSISFSPTTHEVTYPHQQQQLPHVGDFSSSYGPPSQSSYGPPPSSAYGPPPHSSYGPPPPPYGSSGQGMGSLQATYSTSHPLPDLFSLALLPAIDLSWPISLKIDAYTLIKIVLKIIIFKMIVKFIGAVCLLLFVPKLIHKKHEHDEDESRAFDDGRASAERLHLLSSIVAKSMEHYENLNKNGAKRSEESQPCAGLGCRLKRLFTSDDTWDDYIRLFKSYVAEEQQVNRLASKKNRSRRR